MLAFSRLNPADASTEPSAAPLLHALPSASFARFRLIGSGVGSALMVHAVAGAAVADAVTASPRTRLMARKTCMQQIRRVATAWQRRQAPRRGEEARFKLNAVLAHCNKSFSPANLTADELTEKLANGIHLTAGELKKKVSQRHNGTHASRPMQDPFHVAHQMLSSCAG
eukprot:3639116-Pleurochrysis_carterae.AAC.1